jgi:cytochrome c553
MMRWVRKRLALPVALLTLTTAIGAEEVAPRPPDSIKEKLTTCLASHGEGGVSKMEGAPNLAATPDLFLEWQLVYFRSENRKNDIMTPAAAKLTDDDTATSAPTSLRCQRRPLRRRLTRIRR